MSLPSQMYYLDYDGNVILSTFVNVGWFVDPYPLARIIMENATEHKEEFNKCTYVLLYGILVDREFITSCKNFKDFEKFQMYFKAHKGDYYTLDDFNPKI